MKAAKKPAKLIRDVALIHKDRAVATGNISTIRGLIDKNPHSNVLEGEGAGTLAKRLFDEDYFVAIRRNENWRSVTFQALKPRGSCPLIPKKDVLEVWDVADISKS